MGVGCCLIDEVTPPKKTKKNSHPRGTAKSRIWRAETPDPIAKTFCMPGAIQDVITHANFCEDRLRSFGVVWCRILAYFIFLLRRLLNTIALPMRVCDIEKNCIQSILCYIRRRSKTAKMK